MAESPAPRVTELLDEIGAGSDRAAEELLPLVYDELRKLARARMAREGPGQTLQPTGLVHEAYLRLVHQGDTGWANRAHFFAAAAESMRRILIERARRYRSKKHGGELARVTFEEVRAAGFDVDPELLLAVHDALTRLEGHDPEMGRVVKLRFFAGFTVDETAEALAISPRTVKRLWAAGRTWLHREMTRDS